MLKFIKCEKGASAIEYGLLAAGISLAIVAALYAFGDNLALLYDSLSGAVQS